MYNFILGFHNLFRWVAAILLVYALFRVCKGVFAKSSWSEADKKAGLFLTIGLDIQFLLGLLLYFVYSPITKIFFNNMGDAMNSTELRFYGIEHIFYMLLTIVFAHIGSAIGKKDIADSKKFKRVALWFSLALVTILLGMPWARPFLPTF